MKKTTLFALGAASAGLAYYLAKENHRLESERFVFAHAKLPASFDGTKILHLSDLHEIELGKNHARLLAKIDAFQPEYIFISGDVIDGRFKKHRVASITYLMRELCRRAMVFYVNGNHEFKNEFYPELCQIMSDAGVVILENEQIYLEKDHESLSLSGAMDTNLFLDQEDYEETLCSLKPEKGFCMLMSHRPEQMEAYAKAGYHLVFSGHAHGGQIQYAHRKGLFAPGQGLFPKYCDGKYQLDDTTMLVSRGLGNSKFPFRIHSSRHLIEVVLKHQK
jgi:predicted MPP superfamily phosphohydrolase